MKKIGGAPKFRILISKILILATICTILPWDKVFAIKSEYDYRVDFSNPVIDGTVPAGFPTTLDFSQSSFTLDYDANGKKILKHTWKAPATGPYSTGTEYSQTFERYSDNEKIPWSTTDYSEVDSKGEQSPGATKINDLKVSEPKNNRVENYVLKNPVNFGGDGSSYAVKGSSGANIYLAYFGLSVWNNDQIIGAYWIYEGTDVRDANKCLGRSAIIDNVASDSVPEVFNGNPLANAGTSGLCVFSLDNIALFNPGGPGRTGAFKNEPDANNDWAYHYLFNLSKYFDGQQNTVGLSNNTSGSDIIRPTAEKRNKCKSYFYAGPISKDGSNAERKALTTLLDTIAHVSADNNGTEDEGLYKAARGAFENAAKEMTPEENTALYDTYFRNADAQNEYADIPVDEDMLNTFSNMYKAAQIEQAVLKDAKQEENNSGALYTTVRTIGNFTLGVEAAKKGSSALFSRLAALRSAPGEASAPGTVTEAAELTGTQAEAASFAEPAQLILPGMEAAGTEASVATGSATQLILPGMEAIAAPASEVVATDVVATATTGGLSAAVSAVGGTLATIGTFLGPVVIVVLVLMAAFYIWNVIKANDAQAKINSIYKLLYKIDLAWLYIQANRNYQTCVGTWNAPKVAFQNDTYKKIQVIKDAADQLSKEVTQTAFASFCGAQPGVLQIGESISYALCTLGVMIRDFATSLLKNALDTLKTAIGYWSPI